MNNDTYIEGTSRHRDSEIHLTKHTLDRGDDTPVHDVKDLLKCIKLWKKESKENPKLSMPERFQNLSTPVVNSSFSLLNDAIKKFNNSISDGLLKLGDYNHSFPEEIGDGSGMFVHTPGFDENKIISDLNYPIDLNYANLGLDGIGVKKDGDMSEGSSDTRFGTDESDSGNNSYKTSALTTDSELATINQMEYKGKKIDPETINKRKMRINNENEDIMYSKNGNGDTKHVEYNLQNYESNGLEDLENVDYKDIEEFGAMIGELINGENYQLSNESEIDSLIKKQLDERAEMENRQLEQESESILVGDLILPLREFEEDELEEENEENPILSMNNREDAIITEKDILSYGKSDSHTELLPSRVVDKNEPEDKIDMIKDVSVNCQIDQILGTKEEEEPEVEKVRGVCYCKSDNSWTAWWTEKGKSRKKAFKLSLYGYEQARKMAIEHRKQIEDLIPELKEKKTKAGKRKIGSNNGHKITTNNNTNVKQSNTSNTLNTLNTLNIKTNTNVDNSSHLNNQNRMNQMNKIKRQSSIEKQLHFQMNDDGIYKGTRRKVRETLEDQGIYFRDNVWYSTWIDSVGNRVVNSFPVTNELPFLAAKSKAINSCTMANNIATGNSNSNNYNSNTNNNNTSISTNNNSNSNSNNSSNNNTYQIQGSLQNSIKGYKFKRNNSNYYNNPNYRNYEIMKRRKKQLNSSGGSINEGFDHFNNLEKKLEELERGKFNSSQYFNMQRTGQMNSQSAIIPQIFVQTPQELKLTSSESNQDQDLEPTRTSPKLSSLHCQIKLDRSIIKKIENAINKSILEKTNQEELIGSSEQQVQGHVVTEKEKGNQNQNQLQIPGQTQVDRESGNVEKTKENRLGGEVKDRERVEGTQREKEGEISSPQADQEYNTLQINQSMQAEQVTKGSENVEQFVERVGGIKGIDGNDSEGIEGIGGTQKNMIRDQNKIGIQGFKGDVMDLTNKPGDGETGQVNQGANAISTEGPDLSPLSEEKNLENVNALCITQTNSDRRTSINIIPTYIMGPQDTQLLTFVILNS